MPVGSLWEAEGHFLVEEELEHINLLERPTLAPNKNVLWDIWQNLFRSLDNLYLPLYTLRLGIAWVTYT